MMVCPTRHVVNNTLVLLSSSILWTPYGTFGVPQQMWTLLSSSATISFSVMIMLHGTTHLLNNWLPLTKWMARWHLQTVLYLGFLRVQTFLLTIIYSSINYLPLLPAVIIFYGTYRPGGINLYEYLKSYVDYDNPALAQVWRVLLCATTEGIHRQNKQPAPMAQCCTPSG